MKGKDISMTNGEPRRLIATHLGVTPGTVTVYRRLIRLKLRAVPPEQRPAWMLAWLLRFPGGAPGSLRSPSTA